MAKYGGLGLAGRAAGEQEDGRSLTLHVPFGGGCDGVDQVDQQCVSV